VQGGRPLAGGLFNFKPILTFKPSARCLLRRSANCATARSSSAGAWAH